MTNPIIQNSTPNSESFDMIRTVIGRIRRNEAGHVEKAQLIQLLCIERLVRLRTMASHYYPELCFFTKPLQVEEHEHLYSPQMQDFRAVLYATWMEPADYTVSSYLGAIHKNQKALRLIDFTARKLRFCEATEQEITGLAGLVFTDQTEMFRDYAEIVIPELNALTVISRPWQFFRRELTKCY